MASTPVAICLIGDVVGSRRSARAATAWLEQLRDRLEARHPERLAAFEFTQGDEIQGLLPAGSDALDPVLDALLRPHAGPTGVPRMRWAVGVGVVDPGRGPATRRTGEAFLLAREQMTRIHRDGDVLTCATGHPPTDHLLDGIAPVLGSLIDRMTDRQRAVLHLRVIERLRQEDIADRLGISQSAVSGHLSRAGARDVTRLADTVRTLLATGMAARSGATQEPDMTPELGT
jgi:RNA polymerase sigma factor (sigma-70 family)